MPLDFSSQHSYPLGTHFELPPLATPKQVGHPAAKATRPTSKVQNVDAGSGGPSSKPLGDPRAKVEFLKAFPRGSFSNIQTSSQGYLCGLRAVRSTMKHMHVSLPRPTMKELLEFVRSPEFVQHCLNFDLDNKDNFTADQIGVVLYTWGQRRGLNLRLGCTYPRDLMLVPHPNDYPAHIVWIYNDGYNLSGNEGAIGHYTGMCPKRGNFGTSKLISHGLSQHQAANRPEVRQSVKKPEALPAKRKRSSEEDEATCLKRPCTRKSTEFP
ncbi:MAG: hypothetical protein M1836_002319 [Candelina mexicana]|nr:MAG: hypothetical protein M1836_002319 [Candelina mexicana]